MGLTLGGKRASSSISFPSPEFSTCSPSVPKTQGRDVRTKSRLWLTLLGVSAVWPLPAWLCLSVVCCRGRCHRWR